MPPLCLCRQEEKEDVDHDFWKGKKCRERKHVDDERESKAVGHYRDERLVQNPNLKLSV